MNRMRMDGLLALCLGAALSQTALATTWYQKANNKDSSGALTDLSFWV